MSEFLYRDPETGREDLHRHILRIRPKVRRRIRHKFPTLCRCDDDLDDIMSSVHRRLDVAWLRRGIRASTSSELESFILQTAQRVTLDRLRGNRRWRQYQRIVASGMIAARDKKVVDSCFDPADMAAVLSGLNDEDRTSIDLWLRGLRHRRIAEMIGIEFEAHRTCWRRLVASLRQPSIV